MKDDLMDIDSFEDFNRQEIDDKEKLGNILRNKRIMLGLDIKKIAESLRVSEKDLISLESGVKIYDKNKSFGRLLCRKYIKYLEIDFTTDINNLIDIVYPTTFDPSLTQKIETNIKFDSQIKKDRQKNKMKKNLVYIIILIILLFFAVVSVKFFLTNIKNTTDDVVNETTLMSETILTPNEIIKPEKIVEDTITFKEYSDNTATFVLSNFENPGTYNLVIQALENDCYVDIMDVDGNYIGDTGVIKAGEEFSYKIENQSKITINLGNTQSANIIINDQEIDLSKITEPGKNLIIFEVENV